MGRDLTVAIAGATGAMGKELLEVLDAAPWRPDHIVALGRPSSTITSVAYGDETVAVDDLGSEDLSALDVMIVALPRDVAGPTVDRVAAAGVRVVDVSGSQLDDLQVPLAVPWLGLEALDAPRPRDVVAVPGAPALLLASVLAPLKASGWSVEADATVMLPASAWGRDAVDELSRQVVAMFNAAPPPRKVFPHGLAFDVLPMVGTPGATGWTSDEVRAAAEVARLVQLRSQTTLVASPWFHGLTAEIRLEGDDLGADAIAQALTDAGVPVADHADLRRLPRPRRLEGVALPEVARVRDGLDGRSVHLWAGTDNLRAVAVAAVGLAAALLGQADTDA